MSPIRYEWRAEFTNEAINALHAEAFGHRPGDHDWVRQVERNSLGWVCAFTGTGLVGFVNVAWDGDLHAFLLDTMVAADARHEKVGTRLVRLAATEATAAGCIWLHVDFPPDLRDFYLDSCGFISTAAGLLALRG
jgi:ribosomal protein S18 acetylase RimI-like enzyme